MALTFGSGLESTPPLGEQSTVLPLAMAEKHCPPGYQ